MDRANRSNRASINDKSRMKSQSSHPTLEQPIMMSTQASHLNLSDYSEQLLLPRSRGTFDEIVSSNLHITANSAMMNR